MTDNEVVYCFQNGCALLKDDNVDMEDLHEIRESLDKCAKDMLPYIHYYNTGKNCGRCSHNKGEDEACKYRSDCYYTVDRKYFNLKKGCKPKG